MKAPPLRLGVLGSDKGTNFEAIARAIRSGDLSAEIRLVVSDVPDAPILEKARLFGLDTWALPASRYKTRLDPETEEELGRKLLEAGVELVVLAGYMRMVKSPLLDRFKGRIVNIHPSLLPAFPGVEAWRQALDAGVSWTGCTVHWVDAGMDTGEIIAQASVAVEANDSAHSLHERIKTAEQKLYPAVLQSLAESGRLSRGRNP